MNLITVHDGFTLRDLVSYNDKHNEANGESNRDGTTDNRSWNCGVEGQTADAGIQARELRRSLGRTRISLRPSRHQAAALRRVCPCAQCVNEWTGQRTLKPEVVSDELEISDLNIVGRYALNFRWSDGHETGIYSFQYLRDICEQ